MFIQCPACHQRNPQNARECLHCNHPLRRDESSGPSVSLNFEGKSPIKGRTYFIDLPPFAQVIVGAILLAGFAWTAYYFATSDSVSTCMEYNDSRIDRYKAKGYICDEDIFSDRDQYGKPRVCCRPPAAENAE